MGVKPNKNFLHVCRMNSRLALGRYGNGVADAWKLKQDAVKWCQNNLSLHDWSLDTNYWDFRFRTAESAAAFAMAWS
jgi:hypothetical protein